MTDWYREAASIQEDMMIMRRTIHHDPELGRKEFHTASFIEKQLHSYGIHTERVTETGVVGLLRGREEGGCVLFRSDMDALPIGEKTGLSFASENKGIMHACGHDMHIAALLGCACLLSKHRNEFDGTIKFLFEPDEEGDGGAADMIEAGVLGSPYVDAVFGAHCNPDLPVGTVGIKYGSFYAAAATFDVTVHGRGSHGAEPEKGTDSLYAAAFMCCALKKMTGGEGNSRLVVTVGRFEAGTARNIIGEKASFQGIIRTCGIHERKAAMEKAVNEIKKIAAETGTEADIVMKEGYPGVVNHDAETDLVKRTAGMILGRDHVISENQPTMTTEDFGFFLLERPGCFYHIGVGSQYGLHHPRFQPDERALTAAAAVHAAVITEYLKEKQNDRL